MSTKKFSLLLNLEEKDLDHVMILLSAMKLDIYAPYHSAEIATDNDLYFQAWLRKKVVTWDSMLKYLHVESLSSYLDTFLEEAKDAENPEKELQFLNDGIGLMIGGKEYLAKKQ